MASRKRPKIIEDTTLVPVKRTRDLSNKLALLPKDELVLLRRIYDTPDDPKAQTIISQVLLDEYSLQELRLALAALDGVHELPLSEKPLGYENVKPWRPPVEQPPLPPQRIFTPTDETPALPSAKATQEISGILTSMPASDFQWLLAHAGDPQDFRSRLLMVKYRLFKFNWEDVTATLAALQRTIPPSEPEEPL
ncbi:MAG: hypothetical protein Q6364_13870 [Candidatus Hermodarchaeota archaeon]|nr:hypothetical protein [Candidatus Hermodarchaeota archaeon]